MIDKSIMHVHAIFFVFMILMLYYLFPIVGISLNIFFVIVFIFAIGVFIFKTPIFTSYNKIELLLFDIF